MKRGAVGGRVKEIRDRLEWSQDELCARLKDCGYPVLQPNLSLMEQGKRKIDADAIPCFAEVLGVEPNDLYGFRKPDSFADLPREQAPTRASRNEADASSNDYSPTLGDQLGAEELRFLTRMSPKRRTLLMGMARLIDEQGLE